jgi:two-component system, NtrC family, sensor histidine kinase GlrK
LFYYPKSFFNLILGGVVLVMLPLIFAFYNIAVYLERLANQSQRAVFDAVQVTQDSRVINQRITDMERVARQYLVVEDPTLLEAYSKLHRELQQAAQKLNRQIQDTQQRSQLQELIQRENLLFEALRRYPQQTTSVRETVESFAPLTRLGQAILTDNSRIIEREVEGLQFTAVRAREILLWQVLAPLPLAALVAVVFTVLITRPFRQLNSAIRLLGDGHLSTPVRVSGPQDLVDIGKRLDWLRVRQMELQEQKTKFFQHVSHELKTPLAALREGTDLLADEVGGKLTPAQREITGIIQHKTHQLQKLIYDLLAYSATGGAEFLKTSLTYTTFNLKRTALRVFEEQKLATAAKSLRVGVHGPDLEITADAEKIRVLVDNLLSNAIKFSPAGGAIIMTVTQKGERACLDVLDQGPGVADEDREKVFEAFYQGRAPQDARIKGTGLGLAIIKEYVLAHNGSVEIVHDGHPGAHFRVTLPIYPKVGK